jgi:hypothetical protein
MTLKGLLPDNVAGFRAPSLETSSGGAGGMSMAVVKGDYDKERHQLQPGGHRPGRDGGHGGHGQRGQRAVLAGNQTGYEKVGKVGGRMVTEEWDRSAKSGRYSVLVGDRFTVEAQRQRRQHRRAQAGRGLGESGAVGRPEVARGRRQPPLITPTGAGRDAGQQLIGRRSRRRRGVVHRQVQGR